MNMCKIHCKKSFSLKNFLPQFSFPCSFASADDIGGVCALSCQHTEAVEGKIGLHNCVCTVWSTCFDYVTCSPHKTWIVFLGSKSDRQSRCTIQLYILYIASSQFLHVRNTCKKRKLQCLDESCSMYTKRDLKNLYIIFMYIF